MDGNSDALVDDSEEQKVVPKEASQAVFRDQEPETPTSRSSPSLPFEVSSLTDALFNGDREEVKRILQSGVSLNSVLWKGKLPGIDFMGEEEYLAIHIAAHIADADLIRYLTAKGTDVNLCTPIKHLTPLMLACFSDYSNTDVVAALVSAGASVTAKEKDSWTALHYACRKNHADVSQCLLDKGAEVDATSGNGRTPLHIAATTNSVDVANVLLNHNANVNAVDKRGRYPYQCTDGQLRVKLYARWAKAQYDELLKQGTVRPDQVKVCFIGSPKAGKTTLAVVITGKETLPDEDERTAGIDVIVVDIPEAGGRLAFYDTAGHAIFHNTHSLFFSGACIIFAYVVDTSLKKGEILEDAVYFLAFVKSARFVEDPAPHVIFFGSRGETGKKSKLAMCYNVIDVLKEKFGDSFQIYKEPIILDCRNRSSEGILVAKAVLAEVKEICIVGASEVPSVCQKMRQDVLPSLRQERNKSQAGMFMAKEDLEAIAQESVSKALVGELFDRLLSYLQEGGEVVDLSDEVILEVQWLCSNVMAPAMSDRYFPIHAVRNAKGIATIEDLGHALQLFSKVHCTPPIRREEAIKILRRLRLCFPLKDQPNVYQFPTLIEESQREEMWQKEADKSVYVGRRVQCESEIEIIAPAVFLLIQSMMAERQDMVVDIWKGGMKALKVTEDADEIPIEALIEIADERRAITAIDVIVRGPPYSEGKCKKLVDELVFEVMQAKDERSPGTSVIISLLSYNQISRHKQNPVSYLQAEIESARFRDGVVRATNSKVAMYDHLIKLLAVENDHVILIPSEIYTEICNLMDLTIDGSQAWTTVGELLGLDRAKLQRYWISNCRSAKRMMDDWRRCLDATTPRLVRALETIDRADILDVLKETVS